MPASLTGSFLLTRGPYQSASILQEVKPPAGKPYAGELHVRFEGKGGRTTGLPYPYHQRSLRFGESSPPYLSLRWHEHPAHDWPCCYVAVCCGRGSRRGCGKMPHLRCARILSPRKCKRSTRFQGTGDCIMRRRQAGIGPPPVSRRPARRPGTRPGVNLELEARSPYHGVLRSTAGAGEWRCPVISGMQRPPGASWKNCLKGSYS